MQNHLGKKFNDVSVRIQSFSDNVSSSTNQIQLFDWYRQFMRIRRNGAKKKNKNEEEEKKEAVNHDMKFAKNIIVTYDSSEEDRVAKYLTRNLVEEYDRKLAFVMFKQITTKYET